MIALINDEDENDIHLRILSTYGVTRKGENRIETGEGLIGAAYIEKEKVVLDNLPEDYIKIESGLGSVQPTLLILLPLKIDSGEVLGVIEMAFLENITEVMHHFLDEVTHMIALNLHAANLNYKTSILLKSAKEQTEELQAQEEEMRQNLEEMEATHEEFKRREQEYIIQIEELKSKLKKKK